MNYDIPDFLHDDVIHCDRLVLSRKQRSTLVLLRNLRFYEFQKKEVLKCVDLKGTCLVKVEHQLSLHEKKQGKWNDQLKLTGDEVGLRSPASQQPDLNFISFGKYIYQNFETRKVFLLLQCWDKLIVLRYGENTDSLEVVFEYEDVSTYKLVSGSIEYQASVEIKYLDGKAYTTNFNNDSKKSSAEITFNAAKSENFKPLLDRILSAKTELFVHKSITQQEYNRMKNTQTFGCNFLRSQNIEEKQMLAKCGDIWIRFTNNDYAVIGVPLVNNASKETYTILRNLKPILDASEKHSINYTFRLYQLHQCFSNLETLETFFQCEEIIALEYDEGIWNASEETHLLPESFAVLCIKLRISDLIILQQTPFFIFFDIEREINSVTKKTAIFNQQVFITNLDLNYFVTKRALYEITFQESTLHQDLLAIAMTSTETKLSIVFPFETDLEKFEQLLSEHFNFTKLNRHEKVVEGLEMDSINANKTNSSRNDNEQKHFLNYLYYNHNQASTWFNTLVIRYAKENIKPNAGINTKWKFYTTSEEKLFLMLKFILNELILLNCNISEISPTHKKSRNEKIIELEHALRNELNHLVLQCDESSSKTNIKKGENNSKLEQLLQLEMKTDISAKSLLES